MVDIKTPAYRICHIIVALNQRLAGHIIATLDLRRIEGDVIAAPRGGVNPAPAHAINDDLIINGDLDDKIDTQTFGAQRIRLRNSARDTIKEIAWLAIFTPQA